MYVQTKRAATALITAYLLAGCGNVGLNGTDLNALGLSATGAAELRGMAGGQKGGPGGRGGQKGGPGEMKGAEMGLMGLADLSDEQKTQLQAIQAKYRPAKPEGDAMTRPEDTVKAILAAETLDVEALKAALAGRAAPPADLGADRTAMLTEVRAILSDAQRTAIVAKIEAQPEPQAIDVATRPAPPTVDERVAQVAERLSLTDAQKAALVTFETAMAANHPVGEKPVRDHAAMKAAMITFWQTGDTAALTALAPAAVERPAFPVDAFVGLAQLLSAEQRVQVLGRGPGGHEGPGGRGGREAVGFGGHRGTAFGGGRGGHGGPAAEAAATI